MHKTSTPTPSTLIDHINRMWSRTLRSAAIQLRQPRRIPHPKRHISGPQLQQRQQPPSSVPHTTYFQQPPPPPPRSGRTGKIIRTVLWSTFCFTSGAVAYIYSAGIEADLLAELGGMYIYFV